MPSSGPTSRPSRGSSFIGAGVGLVMIGVWTSFAEPVCRPAPGPLLQMCIVEPLLPLAFLFLLAGAGLICVGSISLLLWRRRG